RNPLTRSAYQYAVGRFFDWCERRGVGLRQITPKLVGQYFDEHRGAPATKKLHLAAIRALFDELVVRHAVILNPAASVKGERLEVVEGKTPHIAVQEARKLLASIETRTVVGLRDRAIVATMIYTACRRGAVAKLRRADFYDSGDQWFYRFAEKGGKSREIPVRHDLQQFVREYIERAGLDGIAKDAALFRTAVRREKRLTTNGMTGNDIGRMVKRRMRNAGLSDRFSPHSFRVTAITDLLEQGVPLEDVQQLAGHADPRTTRLYDRRHRKVSRNIVERISV
ncbi:MAG: site-specific integrase, partial [Planctomycetota bacterium]|nr:site-specific integrase [Planctomycetota bacterium]